MVTTVQHRLSSTFSLLANWTWSKCLNEADGNGDVTGSSVSQPNNPSADYGPCGSDYRHIENVVIIAKSKFPVQGLTGLLLNNWEFCAQGADPQRCAVQRNIRPGQLLHQQQQSRPPEPRSRSARVPACGLQKGSPLRRTTLTSTRQPSTRSPRMRAAPRPTPPTAPPTESSATSAATPFRGIPAYNVDAQVSRIFILHERLNLDLRLEAFNLLNHPNFGLPVANLNTTSTFGQVASTSNNARQFQGGIKLSF